MAVYLTATLTLTLLKSQSQNDADTLPLQHLLVFGTVFNSEERVYKVAACRIGSFMRSGSYEKVNCTSILLIFL